MSFNFIKEPKINGYGQSVFTFFEKGFRLNGKARPAYIDIILSGVSPLVLTNAIELNYLKLFGGTEQLPETYLDTVTLSGGTEQRNLPVGYTQVEYLTLDGDQYLLTDYYPNSNTELGIKYYPSDSSRFMCIYGVQDSTSANRFYGLVSSTQYRLQMNYSNQGGGFWSFNNDGTYAQGSSNGTFTSFQEIVSLVIKKDLVSITSDSVGTINYDMTNDGVWGVDVNCTYPLMMGSRSTTGTAGNNFIGNLYPTTIKENSVVLRNYIPCRRNSDNELGMYDTVTGTFLTNAGEGTFTAGADVTPTPDTPMDIVCNNGVVKVSKNLWNESSVTWVQGAYIDTEGNIIEQMAYKYTSTYIPCLPNTTYTISMNKVASALKATTVPLYDENKTFLSRQIAISTTTSTGLLSGTFTTPNDARFLRVSIDNLGSVSQLELGSTATTYMSYGQIYIDGTQEVVTDSLGNTASAERLLAVGDYKDTQEVLTGAVSRNVGILVLDGTEEWKKSGTYIGSFYSNTIFPTLPKQADNPDILCSHGFKVNNLWEYSSAQVGACYWYSPQTINFKYDDGTATLEQFKQWLVDQYTAGTPVIVVYPLATATTETVTPQLLLKSPVTQTAGSIDNLPIAITESEKTVPTPTQPLDINCNNGVLKVNSQGQIYTDGTTETVTVTGKNLFDVSTMLVTGSFIRAGNVTEENPLGSVVSNDSYSCSDYIKVLPSTSYTTTIPYYATAGGAGLVYYTNNSVTGAISGVTMTQQGGTTYTFTTPATCNYIRFSWQNNYGNNAQLELGSTATTYEPYTVLGTATAEMLLAVGSYKDEQEVLDGDVTRNVGVKVLDGTEDWGFYSSRNYSQFYCQDVVTDIGGASGVGLCTHFKHQYINQPGSFYFKASTPYNLYIILENSYDLTTFKQYLADQYNAGTPVIIVYPLATPTTETVTGQPLTVQKGTNIITITQASIDGLEMEVGYKSGVRVTVTEIENAQLSNNVEVTIS